MKRRILGLVLAGIIIIGGCAAWSYINRPAAKVEDVSAIVIPAETLAKEYGKDEAASNRTYLNKAIEVSGSVVEVSRNQDGKTVVLLEAEDPLSGVQCTLRNNAVLKPGEKITVKGFCTGYTLVVLLSDCILL